MAYCIVDGDGKKHKHITLSAKAKSIVKLIENNFPVPETVILPVLYSMTIPKQELLKIVTILNAPYIVRSSNVLEDRSTASFAGLFPSISDIKSLEELSEAVHMVANTSISNENIAYPPDTSTRNGDDVIVIQEYKTPYKSGVIFTQDPENSSQLIIEYSDIAHGVTDATIVPKQVRLDRHSPYSAHSKSDFFGQLVECALKIEGLFNCPQDIEWVYDGKLWIVQSRPITVGISIVQEEINRLIRQFGDNAPQLSGQQFVENLHRATPVTRGLFSQFYSNAGSWGIFLRKYHIPHDSYEVKTYLPSIFGRLYINKTEERRVLRQKIYKKHEVRIESILTTTTSFLNFITHPLFSIKCLFASTKIQINTYYYYKRFHKKLMANRTVREPTIESLDAIRNHMVHETVPLLFQVSAFQDHCVNVLYKLLRGRIDDKLWEQLLRPTTPGFITTVIRKNPDYATIADLLGHRGPQEYELSEPRFEEISVKLLDIYKQVTPNKVPSNTDISLLRKSVANRFASSWDQQMIETYFMLYDYFYDCRDRTHDMWIRELTDMRHILIKLDSEMSLGGLIWYSDLQEIKERYPKLDVNELKKRRKVYQELSVVDLPTEINNESWVSLVFGGTKLQKPSTGYRAERLVAGMARGAVGTIDDLKKGLSVSILIVKSLDPGNVVYFNNISGIITENGGLLSHGTILARELGIPTVRLFQALSLIPKNATVTLNANMERIEVNDRHKLT